MSWKFVGNERGLVPIPGIPIECSDEAFDAAVERYEARFGPEAKGSVKASGLYRQSKPAPGKKDVQQEEAE